MIGQPGKRVQWMTKDRFAGAAGDFLIINERRYLGRGEVMGLPASHPVTDDKADIRAEIRRHRERIGQQFIGQTKTDHLIGWVHRGDRRPDLLACLNPRIAGR